MLWVGKALSHMLNHVWGRSSQKLGKLKLELAAATKNSAFPVAPAVLMLSCSMLLLRPPGGLLCTSASVLMASESSCMLRKPGDLQLSSVDIRSKQLDKIKKNSKLNGRNISQEFIRSNSLRWWCLEKDKLFKAEKVESQL